MADRFPSIEDIDEGKVPESSGDVDLMDGGEAGGDFLTRERAALGADADQFTSAGDDGAANGDLMGGGEDMAQFQSSFPAAEKLSAPQTSVTGRSGSPMPPAPSFADEEEPEVIKQWRESRNAAIRTREEAATARKESTVKAAQEAIDDFYENYNTKKEKGLASAKKDAEEFLAKREDTSAGGTSWERIIKLVDVRKAGSADQSTEIFRKLLIDLSKDKEAPGAKGY